MMQTQQPTDPNSSGANDVASHDEWSAYWKDGRGAACREDDAGLYRGVIADYWRARLGLLDSGARVLDLATGNGAVIEVAMQVAAANARHMRCYGVDQAHIAPRLSQRDWPNGCTVKFLPATSNEALPFAAAMFDQVTSQYGVEYGDWITTAEEACRVLKPGGCLDWVCHWRDGTVARAAQREVEDIQYFQGLSLVTLMQQLVAIQVDGGRFIDDSHRLTANSPQRVALQQGLNQAFARLRERGYGNESNLHLYLRNLAHIYQYREQHAPDLVLSKLAECGQELGYHCKRLQALVNAALTAEQLPQLLDCLQKLGLQINDHGVLREPQEQKDVGYYISAVCRK